MQTESKYHIGHADARHRGGRGAADTWRAYPPGDHDERHKHQAVLFEADRHEREGDNRGAVPGAAVAFHEHPHEQGGRHAHDRVAQRQFQVIDKTRRSHEDRYCDFAAAAAMGVLGRTCQIGRRTSIITGTM